MNLLINEWWEGLTARGCDVGFLPTAIMHILTNTCLILYSLKVKACFEYTAKPTGYNPSICKYLVHLKIYLLSARLDIPQKEQKERTAMTKMGP